MFKIKLPADTVSDEGLFPSLLMAIFSSYSHMAEGSSNPSSSSKLIQKWPISSMSRELGDNAQLGGSFFWYPARQPRAGPLCHARRAAAPNHQASSWWSFGETWKVLDLGDVKDVCF